MRRKYRLADIEHREVDLRLYADIIKNTINQVVQGKNPQVYADCFSVDELSQSQAVTIGRALSKIDELKCYGKTVTIFRLFDGKTYENESATTPLTKKKKTITKGGHL